MRTQTSKASEKGLNKGVLVAHAFHVHADTESGAPAEASQAVPTNIIEKIAYSKYWPIFLALASEFAVHMVVHLVVEAFMHARGHSHGPETAPPAAEEAPKKPCPHCGKHENDEKE